MLKLSIFNQRLSYFADSEVVADSKGYLTFTLETSEDWANYVGKTVQFTRNGVTYSVTNITDNVEYAVPWEVLVGAGTMYVNAFAVAKTGKRATTNQIAVEIIESGLNEDDLKPTDPTPDIFQQYVEQVQENADKAAQSAKEAAQSASDALNYKNKSQEIYQHIEEIQDEVEIINNQVNQAAQNAFQSAQSAQESAQHAAQSEINAAAHESEAKQAAQDAKTSETNAKVSETNAAASEAQAKLEADRAEANQIIVTETKVEIDEIYADIQTRHEDITTKNDNINEKAEQVNEHVQQIEDWYNNFKTGCTYVEFTDEIIHEEEVDTGETVQVGNWELDLATDLYRAALASGGHALLSIQMLNENSQYIITAFVDAIVTDSMVYLYSIAPFAGRLQMHTLVENESGGNADGTANN